MPRSSAKTHRVGLVTLSKRGKKGLWRARYQMNGERVERSLSVTNLHVATTKAQEIDALLQTGNYAELAARDVGKRTTFSDLVQEFRENYTGWSPSTMEKSATYIRQCEEVWGDRLLTQITTKDIEGYLARRRDKDGIAGTTSNRILSFIRVAFKAAVRWGYLGYNPAEPVTMAPEVKVVPESLTADELEKLLEHMNGQAQQMATVLADTGMRISELRKLTWPDVDLEARAVTIRKPKNREERVIPLTSRAREILAARRGRKKKALPAFTIHDIKKARPRNLWVKGPGFSDGYWGG